MAGNIGARQRFMSVCAMAIVATLVALTMGAVAGATNHYPPNRTGAKQFAAAFCPSNPVGMADFVWLSAPGAEDVTSITVTYPDTVIDVRVNAYVQYCSGYPWGADAGSSYWSNIGAPSGNFSYGNTTPGSTWYGYQLKPLDVAGWKEGNHTICMFLASWSVGLSPKPSPSACSVLNLNIIYPWETSGWSRVGVGVNGADQEPNVTSWSAKPGDRLYWRHGVQNTTAYGSSSIGFRIDKSGFSNGWNGIADPRGSFSLSPWETQEIGYKRSWSSYSVYDVVQNDVGRRLCQSISWNPSTGSGGGERNSSDWTGVAGGACASIPYNFNLVPSVSIDSPAVEPGSSIDVNPSVKNNGPTKSIDDTQWVLSRFVVGPTGTKPVADTNGTAPCTYYKNGCQTESSGSRSFPEAPNMTPVGTMANYVVPDIALGSWLCFALSVQPYSSSSAEWSHSAPSCVKVGKKPKIQIWGDDVAVRGSIKTAVTQKDSGVFGSWVEYGAQSVGANILFASGAGLVDQTSDQQKDWSKLTFANSNTPGGVFGLYTTSLRPQPLIVQYFSNGKVEAAYDKARSMDENAFVTGDSVVVRKTDNLDLSAGTLPKGRSLIIVASGTVTIKGNLDYANGAMTSVRDIPQLVIIADKIDIEANVTNVDAWLVTTNGTTGVINTCSDVVGNLSGKVCDKQLTVHGPVLAGKLLLKRTAGSGTGAQSGDPAELFNTRPDAYLWAQMVATGSGRAETVDVVELPPRF